MLPGVVPRIYVLCCWGNVVIEVKRWKCFMMADYLEGLKGHSGQAFQSQP